MSWRDKIRFNRGDMIYSTAIILAGIIGYFLGRWDQSNVPSPAEERYSGISPIVAPVEKEGIQENRDPNYFSKRHRPSDIALESLGFTNETLSPLDSSYLVTLVEPALFDVNDDGKLDEIEQRAYRLDHEQRALLSGKISRHLEAKLKEYNNRR